MSQRDIVIVGCGPAGACAGLALATAGHRITIFERRHEIVSSLCGEGVPGVALEMLRGVTGFDSSPFVTHHPPDGRLVFPDRSTCTLIRDMAVLDRTAWQRALVDRVRQVGGVVELGVRVKRVLSERSEIVLAGGARRSFDLCVDASGPGSRLRPGRDRLACSQLTVAGHAPPTDSLWFILDKRCTAHGGWLFPTGSGYHLGLVGGSRSLKKLRRSLGLSDPHTSISASPIPIGGATFVIGSVVLLGDSGAMASAIHGGGLFPIVASLQPLLEGAASADLSAFQSTMRTVSDAPAQRAALQALYSLSNDELLRLAAVLADSDLSRPEGIMPAQWAELSATGDVFERFKVFLAGFVGRSLDSPAAS